MTFIPKRLFADPLKCNFAIIINTLIPDLHTPPSHASLDEISKGVPAMATKPDDDTKSHKAGQPNPNPNPNPQGQATGQSQKSQIAQYFRSQGRQDDDIVWEIQGLKLRLKDLE